MSVAENDAMIEYWNGVASDRWVRFQEVMDRTLAPFGNAAMAAAGIAAGCRVLDIGCGCGGTSLALARAVGPDGRVLGVDISRPMLARARARQEAGGNLAFEEADAQRHRFEAGSFDVVFSRFGVMFFDDPTAAFGNLRAALAPGGRLAFVCWRSPRDNAWVQVPMGVMARHIPRPAPPEPGAPGPFGFADPARVEQILEAAGFADIEIREHDTPFVLDAGTLDDATTYFLSTGPSSRMLAEADPDTATRDRIVAELREELASLADGGRLALGAAVWIVTARP